MPTPIYQNALIYTIKQVNTGEVLYVGSTCNFYMRKKTHKSDSNKNIDVLPLDKYIKEIGGWNMVDMTLHSYYPCHTKLELRKREREVRDEIKPKCNMRNPYTSEEEKKQQMKLSNAKYYQENKKHKNEYSCNWNKENKDRRNKKIICECGLEINKTNLSHHRKRNIHITRMQNLKSN
jgi:hypothetical protein